MTAGPSRPMASMPSERIYPGPDGRAMTRPTRRCQDYTCGLWPFGGNYGPLRRPAIGQPGATLTREMDGETISELAAATPRAMASLPPGTTLLQLPMDQDGACWEKSSTAWTRYHKNFRFDLYHFADDQAGGLDYNFLEDKHVTFKQSEDGSDYHIEDSWNDTARGEPTDKPRAGRTVSYEFESYPRSTRLAFLVRRLRLRAPHPRSKGYTA